MSQKINGFLFLESISQLEKSGVWFSLPKLTSLCSRSSLAFFDLLSFHIPERYVSFKNSIHCIGEFTGFVFKSQPQT